MEEKQFHNFQKLIDNLSKEDLMKIKIIIEDKLCGNRDILNLNLEDFLNREKYLTNFKGRLYINDIINAVGHYCHIPNDKVKVYDLIGIDLNLFTKQYHIGNTTIKYLENFLNNYGLLHR